MPVRRVDEFETLPDIMAARAELGMGMAKHYSSDKNPGVEREIKIHAGND